jgi:hypothetical protein
MEKTNEFVWQKYDKILNELENKLAAKKCVPGLEEHAPARPQTAAAVEPEPENDRVHVEAKIDGLILENKRLKEETIFLRAESGDKIYLQEEIFRIKKEFEQVSREKESEISRLYAMNKCLEERAGTLRFAAQRRSLKLLEEAAKRHKSRNKKREKTGILEWLSKPLIIVETE